MCVCVCVCNGLQFHPPPHYNNCSVTYGHIRFNLVCVFAKMTIMCVRERVCVCVNMPPRSTVQMCVEEKRGTDVLHWGHPFSLIRLGCAEASGRSC